MTDWQSNYPPGTLPQDVSDRQSLYADEDDLWWSYWWEDQRLRWEEAHRNPFYE